MKKECIFLYYHLEILFIILTYMLLVSSDKIRELYCVMKENLSRYSQCHGFPSNAFSINDE